MEKILVVKTEYLRRLLKPAGFFTEGLDELSALVRERGEFIPRPDAESDPSYKQIIPYVSISRGGCLFATRRLARGGEARLHGLISLGVGGHINPGDGADLLTGGMLRELHEEVELSDSAPAPVLRGLINDDTNGVGSVHLGFFYTLETDGDVAVRELEKLEGLWLTARELEERAGQMETWSQLVVPYLRRKEGD